MKDIQLHYIEKGEGEPLLLLHGNGEDCHYFFNQIVFFSQKYRVMALDTRGHGASPRGKAPFTLEQFARDLYDFMEEHKLEKANILGFSDGGNIALIFALEHPEKVNRLILNGANLEPFGVKASIQCPIAAGYYMASLFSNFSSNARKKAELLRLMVKEPDISPQQLKRLSVKTLVIAGTKDMIREKHTRLIAKTIPHAQLALVEGDHFIARKNPKAFNRIVYDFLDKN